MPGDVPGIRASVGLAAKSDADGQDKPGQGRN
jgi:hypothetical protein